MSGETPSDADQNYYFVCKLTGDGNYEETEGPDGVIAQIFRDETIKPLEESGDVGISMLVPHTAFGLMISRRVAADVLRVLRGKGILLENRGSADFPR